MDQNDNINASSTVERRVANRKLELNLKLNISNTNLNSTVRPIQFRSIIQNEIRPVNSETKIKTKSVWSEK